jgi:hypothetical protein
MGWAHPVKAHASAAPSRCLAALPFLIPPEKIEGQGFGKPLPLAEELVLIRLLSDRHRLVHRPRPSSFRTHARTARCLPLRRAFYVRGATIYETPSRCPLKCAGRRRASEFVKELLKAVAVERDPPTMTRQNR